MYFKWWPKIKSPNMHTHFYWPQWSCGQGNVLTGVCLSTGGRVSASVHAGMPYPLDQADTLPPPGTRQTPPGPGRHPPGTRQNPSRPGRPTPQTRQIPPRSRLQHTVYEWPVRILLECILVSSEVKMVEILTDLNWNWKWGSENFRPL